MLYFSGAHGRLVIVTRVCAFVFFVAIPALVSGEIKLASPFGDHMVLQQGQPVPVWGTATPGENITVEFAGQKKSTVTGTDGNWRIELKKLKASAQPRDLLISSGNRKSEIVNRKLTDVLVGEVWLCGGQSNMERQLGLRSGQKPIVNWEQEVAAATHPLIRQFYVVQHNALETQSRTDGSWTVCSPATVANFTAVGYFFARDLQAKLGVPVGIIHSSIGGTPAEAWTSKEGLKAFPEFAQELEKLQKNSVDPLVARQAYMAKLSPWFQAQDPGSGDQPWSKVDLDTAGWETMNLPALWEEAGHPDYDGVAWFRKSFDLPANWSGHELKLQLCGIDDIDTTWVNGTEIGATSGYTLARTYSVPAALLKPTGNVIAIRVLDTGGGGGIWEKSQPFALTLADGSGPSVALAGPWLARFSHPLNQGPRPPRDAARGNGSPTVLYNAMIAPLIPYAMRGVIFYQGEANADRATQYRTLFPALIADWRQRWGQGDFPFLFVQIAPFKDQPPEIREAQLQAWQETKNTAMAVTIDVGDAKDIHPANKAPVGARLALAARALAYGEKLEYSGPVYSSIKLGGGHAELHFTHVGGGLVAKDGALNGFTIAGTDGVFHPAKAEIVGETVVVSSPDVPVPAAVRYGWANVASGNLFNVAGLPASPFRTDSK